MQHKKVNQTCVHLVFYIFAYKRRKESIVHQRHVNFDDRKERHVNFVVVF